MLSSSSKALLSVCTLGLSLHHAGNSGERRRKEGRGGGFLTRFLFFSKTCLRSAILLATNTAVPHTRKARLLQALNERLTSTSPKATPATHAPVEKAKRDEPPPAGPATALYLSISHPLTLSPHPLSLTLSPSPRRDKKSQLDVIIKRKLFSSASPLFPQEFHPE